MLLANKFTPIQMNVLGISLKHILVLIILGK